MPKSDGKQLSIVSLKPQVKIVGLLEDPGRGIIRAALEGPNNAIRAIRRGTSTTKRYFSEPVKHFDVAAARKSPDQM